MCQTAGKVGEQFKPLLFLYQLPPLFLNAHINKLRTTTTEAAFPLSGKPSNTFQAMAKTGMATAAAVLNVALMAAVWTVATAQVSSNCMNVLVSMSPCLNYITGNTSTPAAGCCTQLASVVQSQPKCLCEVISGNAASSLGISINQTLALELPSACNVKTPSVSRCSGASSPSGSPPSPSTPSTPSSSSSGTSITPSGKSTPSVDTANGHVVRAGLALFGALFLFAGSACDLGFAAV